MTEEQNKPEEEQIEQPENGTTPESTEANELEKVQAELKDVNDRFLRLYAEFDNFKRRTMKEKSEFLQVASKEVMLALLPVIDDFERAQKAEVSDIKAYKEGIDLIHQKFNNILTA